MNILRQMQATAVIITWGLVPFGAQAAIVTYPDVTAFLSAAGVVALESFEQAAPLPYGPNPLIGFGAFTVSTSGPFGGNGYLGILTSGPTMGQHATDGTQYLASNA